MKIFIAEARQSVIIDQIVSVNLQIQMILQRGRSCLTRAFGRARVLL